MKSFFKYVLATVVGLIVMGILCVVIYVVGVAALLSGSEKTPKVEEGSVLVIQLDGTIAERAVDDPLARLNPASEEPAIGLDDLLAAIREAQHNDKVQAIYIEASGFTPSGQAKLYELHEALTEFKTSGKPIIAYADTYSQSAYYLCALADSLVLNPEGTVVWSGMGGSLMYYKEVLERLGIEVQVFKVGTYKSAVEPFILDEMSEDDREQRMLYLNEIWAHLRNGVAIARGIDPMQVDSLADYMTALRDPSFYIESGMVDKLAYGDEIPSIIANTLGLEDKDDYHTIGVKDLARAAKSTLRSPSAESIVVYYAVGNIVDEPGRFDQGSDLIVGKDVAEDLLTLAEDEDVKAVVLRINSGGGSAYASEQIDHAVRQLKAAKPVIVSMSDLAASGGYYIASSANWIIAEPTTLTGSIGIFGLLPNAQKLAEEKIGLHFSTVKTHEKSDFGNLFNSGSIAPLARPLSQEEKDIMQAYLDHGYDLFTRRCAEGRSLPQDSIKAIAEGRVWTGEHALGIGLVDQLGSLADAIDMAKDLAGIEDECNILAYPLQPTLLERLLSSMEERKQSYADAQLRQLLGPTYPCFITLHEVLNQQGVQARMPYLIDLNL